MKPNDYDGDKKADIVYLAGGTSGGAWMQVGNPTPLWAGLRTDVNVGGDYDNDGKWEPAELSGRDWYSSKLPAPIHYDPVGLPTAAPDWPNPSSTTQTILPVPADYDGDGDTDPAYYALINGTWWINGRAGSTQFGTPPNHNGHLDWDVPVPGDYDGDLKADIAVFSPRDHLFRILQSKTGTERIVRFPTAAALMPVPADYDGDGTTDPAVANASGLAWWLTPDTTAPTYIFGAPAISLGDATYPVVADYDGDAKADPAVYDYSTKVVRGLVGGAETTLATLPSDAGVMPALPFARLVNIVRLTFYGKCLSGQYQTTPNQPVPNWQVCPPAAIPYDLDGDHRADLAWIDSIGAWHRVGESTPFWAGEYGTLPVPGDYDGNGSWEPAFVRDLPGDVAWVTPTQTLPSAEPPYTLAHYPDWYGGASVGSPVLAVPGRYEYGNHRSKPAYYVIATGTWYVDGIAQPVTFGTTPTAGGDLGWDVPVPGDYDGRNQDGFAVYRPTDSTFRSWLTGQVIQVGRPGDRPAPADYDGNGTTDPATYRPETGEWSIAGQPTRSLSPAVDSPADWVPVPADYDGDGRADLSLYNLHDGRWVVEGRGLVATLGANTFPVEYPRSLALSMPRLIAYGSCLHDPAWAALDPGHCAGTP